MSASSTPLALVTGAGGGIGSEVSRRLIAKGFDVLALDATEEAAARAADELGAAAHPVACDLTDRAAVASLCSRIAGEWSGRLDVVVCNAGIIVPGDVVDTTAEVIDLHLDIMLRSALHIIGAAVPAMIERDRGHVLATVSIGGIAPMPTSAAYSAAKAGLRAYLASLNAELHGTSVQVSGIYPSAVDTPMLHREARTGGSALNFIGPVHSVETVADAYDKALEKGRLEVYVPYSDSLTSRIASAMPWGIPYVLPLLDRIGERGRKKYIARTGG